MNSGLLVASASRHGDDITGVPPLHKKVHSEPAVLSSLMCFSLGRRERMREGCGWGVGVFIAASAAHCSPSLGAFWSVLQWLFLACTERGYVLWIIHWESKRNWVVCRAILLLDRVTMFRWVGGYGFCIDELGEEGGWFTSWKGCCRAPWASRQGGESAGKEQLEHSVPCRKLLLLCEQLSANRND